MIYYAIKDRKTGKLYAGSRWPDEEREAIWASKEAPPEIFGRPEELPPEVSAAILREQARIVERRFNWPQGSLMVVPVVLDAAVLWEVV